jgi:hypothetical protein
VEKQPMSEDGRFNREQKPARLKIDFGIILIVLFAAAGIVLSLVFVSTLGQLLAL